MTNFSCACYCNKMNSKYIIPLILFLLMESSVIAQTQLLERLVPSTGSITNSNYELTWSLGEVFTNTFTNSAYQASEGFNESSRVYLITGINEMTNREYKLYPNPFSTSIILEASTKELVNLELSFLDEQGRIIQFDVAKEKNRLEITPRQISTGLYILSLKNNKGEIQQFKVIRK